MDITPIDILFISQNIIINVEITLKRVHFYKNMNILYIIYV